MELWKWNDETQGTRKDIVPFTYEQIVEIKDLTYESLLRVQENILDLFPSLPKLDYKTLVDEYYLSVNIKHVMEEPAFKHLDTDNVVSMSGIMLSHLLECEWQNFRVPREVKRDVLHASIFEYPLSEDVVHSLIENIIYRDTWADVDEDA